MASSMTKSALRLARLSLQIAQASLPAYAHKFSPKRYTQPQLFSILVLRQFFKTDYRGIVVLLNEWAELRSTLGLKQVPNYSTLCYAQRRLCTQPVFECLLQQIIQQAQAQQVIKEPSDITVDATGLEIHHGSHYYIQQKDSPRTKADTNGLLELAAKVYEGLSDADLDDMEEIIHDRRNFFGDRT